MVYEDRPTYRFISPGVLQYLNIGSHLWLQEPLYCGIWRQVYISGY